MSDSNKLEWLKTLKKVHNFLFCGLKETNLSAIPPYLYDRGDNIGFGINFIDLVGRSGGLICLWDMSFFHLITIIKSNFFMVVVGYWRGVVGERIIVNVYAPQVSTKKAILWNNIQNLLNSRPGIRLIFGDFNA